MPTGVHGNHDISNICGGPPEGHSRQCKARSSHSGVRCKQWALKTKDYCRFHGGRKGRRIGLMPTKYSKVLSKTLQEKVQEFATAPHEEQVGLYEELALIRVAAESAVQLAGVAIEKGDDATKAMGVELMQTALSHVKEFVLATAKIDAMNQERVTVAQLSLFVTQIIRCIHFACEGDVGMATRIEEYIQDNVVLPAPDALGLEMDGTVVTPSMLAEQMDQMTTGDNE